MHEFENLVNSMRALGWKFQLEWGDGFPTAIFYSGGSLLDNTAAIVRSGQNVIEAVSQAAVDALKHGPIDDD